MIDHEIVNPGLAHIEINSMAEVESAEPTTKLFEELGRTSRGYTLFREENGVGGHTYISDEIGGGVIVWDTSLVDIETLFQAIKYEQKRRINEELKNG
jgi:hypothetical protein